MRRILPVLALVLLLGQAFPAGAQSLPLPDGLPGGSPDPGSDPKFGVPVVPPVPLPPPSVMSNTQHAPVATPPPAAASATLPSGAAPDVNAAMAKQDTITLAELRDRLLATRDTYWEQADKLRMIDYQSQMKALQQ